MAKGKLSKCHSGRALWFTNIDNYEIQNSHKEVEMSRNPGFNLIGLPQHVI